MDFSLGELAEFLVKAKRETYAGGGAEAPPERPGFKELEFREGDWHYRDSYAGFFRAPGQEIVKYKGTIVWSMMYSGGMREEYLEDTGFARKTFAFLKKALIMVEKERPFRGPPRLEEGEFLYTDKSEGNIEEFKGTEQIFCEGKEAFRQDYIGGLVLGK